jgi:hypothetical protein
MKNWIITLIILLGAGYLARAQVLEQPLRYNGVLQSQQIERAQKLQQIQQALSQGANLQANKRGSGDDFRCVYTGTTDTLCIEPTSGPGSGQFDCLDCGAVQNGSASLDDNCLIFTPPAPGFEFGKDTVNVEFCDTLGKCDTFRYHYVISRPSQNIIEDETIIFAESEVIFDVDTMGLPTAFESGWGFDCNDPLLSDFFGLYTQGFYSAKRFAGLDTACHIILDQYCVVDTFRFPVRILQDTLALASEVFFDDFSYDGPYPSGEYWLDKHTFRNNTLGSDPPSVGMLTFDGVDETGTPYGDGYGVSDYLTSIYMDTRNLSNTAYLTFWLQIKGYGLPPLDPDSLVVEFRQPDGEWRKMEAYPGDVSLDIDELPPFEFHAIEITPEFQFNGFQFRFRNSSNNKGVTSMWHLDYVLVRDGFFQAPETSFSDLAFVKEPSSILKRYSSMPWDHFYVDINGELGDAFDFSVVNRFNTANSISGSGRILFREDLPGEPNLLPNGFTLSDATNLGAGEQLDGVRSVPANIRTDLISALENNYPDTGKYVFLTEYNLVSGAGQSALEGVERNDTVQLRTHFDNYFAYDDGTAERNLVTFKKGMMIAVKYHANKPDSLQAIQMHLQHAFSNLTNQLMNLHVWIGELDEEPEYTAGFVKPFYPDAIFDTLQGFTTYQIMDQFGTKPEALFIPAGDFYIGWEQNTNNNPGITVGFDKNSPEGKAYGYVFNTVNWSAFTDYPETFFGSVMMRPVMGSQTPVNTPNAVKEQKPPSIVRAFPNPVRDYLRLEGPEELKDGGQIRVFDLLGRVRKQQNFDESIFLGDLEEGVYFLIIEGVDGNLFYNAKITILPF